jgi:hypothetical protein
MDAGRDADSEPDASADAAIEPPTPCTRRAEPTEGEPLASAAILDRSGKVHACFRETRPAFELWSDGLVATRWLHLPPGARIDGADLEHFEFPVGTRALKRYSTADGRPVELRAIERTASGYRMGTYLFTSDGMEAFYTELGGRDALGLDPPHDVPSSAQCSRCHGGEPGRLLGVSAFQLGRGGSPTPGALVAEGVLELPALDRVAPPFADAAVERALGALHANCAHCHADEGTEAMLDYVLRVEADALAPESTRLYATNLGVTLTMFSTAGVTLRVSPGDAQASGTFLRLAARDATQMPDIATRLRNLALEEAVQTWISSLAP